jgi:hypothetical protein
MKLALLIGACALAALGEDARLTGPAPGFVFDRASQSIRPILGVLGSSHLGSAVAGGFEVASISPLGTFALATQGSKLYLVRNLDASQADFTPLDSALSGATRFAWAQDGMSVGIYSADTQRAQILRSLTNTPAIDDFIDLSSLDGKVSVLALDGSRLLIGAASPDSGGVYVADGQSAPKLLMRAANPVALSLDTAKGDLYIADRDNNQIWMVRGYAGDAVPMLFAGDRAGVSSPVGIRISGGRLLVANAGSRSIDAFDIATRASLAHVDLDFAPARMDALGSGQLSLLNFGGPDEPLYVLDGGANLAVYFVPAGGDQ